MKSFIPMRARPLAIALLTAAGLAVLTAASAQETVLAMYDVELVIFQQLSPEATPEEWGLEAALADQQLPIPDEDASPFGSIDAAPAPAAESFPALPASKYQLTAIEEALRRSRNYRPIAHFGWTQPGYPRNEARFFPIDSLIPASSGLMGEIALTRGRFLHLTLDLSFDKPEEPGRRYVLRQSRRMRSSERHYIDHPQFGVIAVITPSDETRD